MAEKYVIKILTLGDATVGKSSIVLRYSDNKFNDTILSTIGVDSKRKIIKVNGEKIKVSIWDTAGQEKFQNIVKQYYNGANGVLLIYDITSKKSFDRIQFWYDDLSKNSNIEELFICLVGNKLDLKNTRVITIDEAQKYAKKLDVPYFEVSAKSGEGIKELFNDIIKKIMDKIKSNDLDEIEEKIRTSFLEKDNLIQKDKKCC